MRLLTADPECLDPDDYTPIDQVADDDYTEGCDDEDGHAKARKVAKPVTTTTAKAAPTTVKKAPSSSAKKTTARKAT